MTGPGARDWDGAATRPCLHPPGPGDDKYSRGVVGVRTGSAAYPGAAVLGVAGAWRAGAGMVRYVGPGPARAMVLAHRPETVAVPGRVACWLVGSGTDAEERTLAEEHALRSILSGPVPVIVDAGALDLAPGAAAPRVLTPHAGEWARLRAQLGLAEVPRDADEAERERALVETARAVDAVVLLKGSTTLVAEPGGALRRVRSGAPWLATAGTGDVLGGALAAVVAAHWTAGAHTPADLADAAASAAWLHGRAGVLAAHRGAEGPGPVTALDVAGALPRAVAEAVSGSGDAEAAPVH